MIIDFIPLFQFQFQYYCLLNLSNIEVLNLNNMKWQKMYLVKKKNGN